MHKHVAPGSSGSKLLRDLHALSKTLSFPSQAPPGLWVYRGLRSFVSYFRSMIQRTLRNCSAPICASGFKPRHADEAEAPPTSQFGLGPRAQPLGRLGKQLKSSAGSIWCMLPPHPVLLCLENEFKTSRKFQVVNHPNV